MRSLVPYFFISTHPVGWKCSACGQIFRVPLNVLDKPTSKPDDDVQVRFAAHSCLAYRDKLQLKQKAASGEGSEPES
jgi:hypothetical protein